MKKTIALCALVLSILAGLVSGSLALYQKSVDFGDASVVAKAFTLLTTKTENYAQNIPIAPSETVPVVFTVQNFDGDIGTPSKVTETKMKIAINIDFSKKVNSALNPADFPVTARIIEVTEPTTPDAEQVITNVVFDENGDKTINIEKILDPNVAKKYTYTIEFSWDEGDVTDTDGNGISDDAEFEGHNNGIDYSVTVTGTQVVTTP